MFNKSFFFFLTVLLNLAYSIEIFPDTPEIIINEGDPLTIKCAGSDKSVVIFPHGSSTKNATSPVEFKEENVNEEHIVTLERRVTVPGDTGYYGCSDSSINGTTYVYVQSNTSLFVDEEDFNSVEGKSTHSVTLNCRPTSPDYDVILYRNDDEDISNNENIHFDPKEGFKINNLSLTDAGYYRCVIQQGDEEQEMNYHLIVIRNVSYLSQPKIIEDNLQHVVQGQNLSINCIVEATPDIIFALEWDTPFEKNNDDVYSSRISRKFHHQFKPANNTTYIIELVIKNITIEDAGQYECIAKSFTDTQSTKSSNVNITIQET